jgi:hypothetical protein
MLMSAFRPKRTSLAAPHMSAFGGKADIPIAPIILTFEVVSFEERHHCTGHRRDQLLIASVYCERLCLTDSNSSTGFTTLPLNMKPHLSPAQAGLS